MFPDAVNQPNYPSSILRPGGEFRQQIIWRFFNTPASTDSSLRSCQAKFPGCSRCKGGKCTDCARSGDIPDPQTNKVRADEGGRLGRCLGGSAQKQGPHRHQPSLPSSGLCRVLLQCRPKTCAEANPGCSTCKKGDLYVCTKCLRLYSLVSKTKKARPWQRGLGCSATCARVSAATDLLCLVVPCSARRSEGRDKTQICGGSKPQQN